MDFKLRHYRLVGGGSKKSGLPRHPCRLLSLSLKGAANPIVSRERLGGILKYYYRAA